MRKSTLLFEATLEIYLVIRSRGSLRYHLAHTQPSRSFVKQWVQAIKANFQYAAEANVKDTSAVLRAFTPGLIQINAALANALFGIVLGTGNTPVAISDYKLQTQIAHGSGAGQLNYKEVFIDALELVGSTAKFRSRRQYENLSGSTITVKEAGIYAVGPSAYYYCLIRDILTSPFDIPNTQIAEFRYTFKATV